jgi:putative ABC transport system permease protein
LTACLAGVAAWMRRSRQHAALYRGPGALAWLGIRNASRHAARSLLTIGLLASATFLVVAVESFHKEAGHDFFDMTGGSGGFRLLAEADVPYFEDLNDPKVRTQLNATALEGVTVYSFGVRPGDDASCLNLYQPLRPRILGVPDTLVRRGGFTISGRDTDSAEEKENPWLLLHQRQPDNAIPVLVDANSAQWILKVAPGDTLEVPDENGDKRKLRVVGLLHESIFQSEVLMAQDNFKALYRLPGGFQYFLIECPADKTAAVKSFLETALGDHGVIATPTEKRLEAYLAVENTYLATFQALGGFGLLLGALGLAVVLTRSVWERRGELALLRALGFRNLALGWLVLAENCYLLVLGLAVGAVAALAAVAPHLTGDIVWTRLGSLLGLVLAVGLIAATTAVAATLRAPLLTALRRE